MFEKAECLLQKKGLVVPNPGATNGSYIIAGSTNNVYLMIPERRCINAKSKICEHVLAVAEHIGALSKFLKWFTLSKSGPSFGKKGSKRKKSNMSKLPVVEVCNIINTSPDEDILQLLNNFPAIKKTKAKNRVAEKMMP